MREEGEKERERKREREREREGEREREKEREREGEKEWERERGREGEREGERERGREREVKLNSWQLHYYSGIAFRFMFSLTREKLSKHMSECADELWGHRTNWIGENSIKLSDTGMFQWGHTYPSTASWRHRLAPVTLRHLRHRCRHECYRQHLVLYNRTTDTAASSRRRENKWKIQERSDITSSSWNGNARNNYGGNKLSPSTLKNSARPP